MAASTYLKNKVADAICNAVPFGLAADPWLSLHTASPGVTGDNEVLGGGYVRRQVACSAAVDGAISNLANIDFSNMPAALLTHAGLWDAQNGGNFLSGAALFEPKTLGAGQTFRVPAGDLDFEVD